MSRRPPFWVNGEPTEHAIEVFTEGDCWALAMQIVDMTPLNLYQIEDGRHWVAGDGKKFLDITGVSSRSQLLRSWGARSLHLADPVFVTLAREDIRLGRFMFIVSLDRRRLRDAAVRVVTAHAEEMGLVLA